MAEEHRAHSVLSAPCSGAWPSSGRSSPPLGRPGLSQRALASSSSTRSIASTSRSRTLSRPVEARAITLIGATTENPSFAVNAAPLALQESSVWRRSAKKRSPRSSRALSPIIARARRDGRHRADAARAGPVSPRGDARRALTALEVAVEHGGARSRSSPSSSSRRTAITIPSYHDKAGEEHYSVVSAFIKSMRGSDPDAPSTG
ncbi:MAG: hypothetical protein U0235_16760 [Polyangiaceae bacterium]